MKKLSISVAVTALIAFLLGYVMRGPIERTSSVSNVTARTTLRNYTESPKTQAQAIMRTDQDDADAPVTTSQDYQAALTSPNSMSRELSAKYKRDRLKDFFLINGIGPDRAEQIVQDLVDADDFVAEMGNAMLDRHTAEKAEMIARGDVVEITYTAEERAELEAEQERLDRQVFGEYYEAYEAYRRSYPQRRVVGDFSSRLSAPLEYATKESIVQIMYEEYSSAASEQESKPADFVEGPTSTTLEQVDQRDSFEERLLEMRSYNNRVIDRTRPYLTPSQSEELKELLENEVRRFELLVELAELDEAS